MYKTNLSLACIMQWSINCAGCTVLSYLATEQFISFNDYVCMVTKAITLGYWANYDSLTIIIPYR